MSQGDQGASILTEAELTTPRSAADMLPWVREAAARFNTEALRAEARAGKHFNGVLMGEALPMALFAYRYYEASQKVRIQHILGNQNFDATVADSRPHPDPIEYLEVTTTLMSYEDSLRLELMNTQGYAPAYGLVTAVGPRHNRSAIVAESIALEHGGIVSEHLQRVSTTVHKKAGKHFQPNTALIVAIDDYVPFERTPDVAALDSLARSSLVPLLSGTNIRLLGFEGNKQTHRVYPIA